MQKETFVEIKKFKRDIQVDLSDSGTKCKGWRYGDKIVQECTVHVSISIGGMAIHAAQAMGVFNFQQLSKYCNSPEKQTAHESIEPNRFVHCRTGAQARGLGALSTGNEVAN